MPSRGTAYADLWFGAFLVAACVLVLWGSRDIPPGTFEPLGSAPIPRTVAIVIICLTLLVMTRAWRQLRAGANGGSTSAEPVRLADAAIVASLTLVYALALHLRIARFDVLSAVYLFIAIGVLVRFERRKLPYVAAVAVITGFGCQFIFTRIFVVDLPGAF